MLFGCASPLAGSLITSGVLSPLSLFFERSFCYSNLCKWLCITYLMLCFLGGGKSQFDKFARGAAYYLCEVSPGGSA